MARKITNSIVDAFMYERNYKSGNSSVELGNSEVNMFLFGNLIAKMNRNTGHIYITNCGFFTNTTKERLNGIPNVSIQQKAGKWYLNGSEWDGKWTNVK